MKDTLQIIANAIFILAAALTIVAGIVSYFKNRKQKNTMDDKPKKPEASLNTTLGNASTIRIVVPGTIFGSLEFEANDINIQSLITQLAYLKELNKQIKK
ncbi:MAG: hypothetical protein V4506_19280 [Bacteroidota bacterium]